MENPQFVEYEGVLESTATHDGYVHGIYMESDEESTIYISDTYRSSLAFSVTGVKYLKMDEFRKWNIISEIVFYKKGEISIGFSTKRLKIDEKYLKFNSGLTIKRIEEEGLEILQIVSIYGCSLIVIFDGGLDAIQVEHVDGSQ